MVFVELTLIIGVSLVLVFRLDGYMVCKVQTPKIAPARVSLSLSLAVSLSKTFVHVCAAATECDMNGLKNISK